MSPGRQRLAAVLLPALLVLVVWYQFLRPGGTSNQAAAEVVAVEQQAALLASQVAQAKAAERDITEIRDRLPRLRASIPEQADVGAYLVAHDELARLAGVTIVLVTPRAQAAGAAPTTTTPTTTGASTGTAPVTPTTPSAGGNAPLSSTVFDLSVRGEPARVADYLARLRAQPRLTVIDTFTLTREADGQQSLSLVVRVFHAPSAAPAPTTPGGTPTSAPPTTLS